TCAYWCRCRVCNDLISFGIFCRNGFFKPHEIKWFQLLGDLLTCYGIISSVHITTDINIRANGLTCGGNLINHSLNLTGAGRPVVSIILLRIVPLVKVELDTCETHILAFFRGLRKIRGRWQIALVQSSITIDSDLVSEFSSKELINGYVEYLARDIPQCRLDRRQHCDIYPGLRSAEYSGASQVFKQAMIVQRISALESLLHHLHKMIGPSHCVDPFAPSVHILIR